MTANISDIDNTSYIINPEDLGNNLGTFLVFLNYVCLFANCVIIALEALAINVLRKCKRIPSKMKILSISFIFSDLVGMAVFAVHEIIIFGFGYTNDVMFNSRVTLTGTITTVTWASVMSFTIERLLALKLNIRYQGNVTKKWVFMAVTIIWGSHIGVITALIVHRVDAICNWNFKTCDVWETSKPIRLFMLALLILYESIVVIAYKSIHLIVKNHVIAITNLHVTTRSDQDGPILNRQYSATKAIVKIVLAFVILHTPLCIHLIVFETHISGRNETYRHLLNWFSYVCIQANSIVSLSLYVGQFKECKMHLYFYISKFVKSFSEKAENERIKVFNIVTYEGSKSHETYLTTPICVTNKK